MPTHTSEVYNAFLTDDEELTGDDPRQCADPENVMGGVVVDHGGSFRMRRELSARKMALGSDSKRGIDTVGLGVPTGPRKVKCYHVLWILLEL